VSLQDLRQQLKVFHTSTPSAPQGPEADSAAAAAAAAAASAAARLASSAAVAGLVSYAGQFAGLLEGAVPQWLAAAAAAAAARAGAGTGLTPSQRILVQARDEAAQV